MQLKVTGLSYGYQWYDKSNWPEDWELKWPYPDEVRLRMRPHPNSMKQINFDADDGLPTMKGKKQFEIFDYCLGDWAGVTDENDQDLDLNKDYPIEVEGNKKTMPMKRVAFDFALGEQEEGKVPPFSAFVIHFARNFKAILEKMEKN